MVPIQSERNVPVSYCNLNSHFPISLESAEDVEASAVLQRNRHNPDLFISHQTSIALG
jgi:hypothetical protein